ncbi:ankyrin repeat domain-containing protein [Legionella qingyii]|uniref:Ankyrin repeat domain-containing protein n=2 Tax=Legionella qingyii TaxID=2184757 RepID=A0ABY0CFB8_9GAMM|nr:Dot/Icm T4SS effector AnkK/LegA5 [Legionella qingyii]RUR20146.1 ankyrin repeat domain-containing protein [Legionella qingyii]
MAAFFQIRDITLGPASHASGHEAYLKAVYTPPNREKPPYKIIYKKNKYDRAEFSRLEVMFSQLARLFLLSDLTPSNNLVVDEEKNILGLAVQHLCYVIANKERSEHDFYTLNDPNTGCTTSPFRPNDPIQIPIYFLDKLPQGFFARLVEAEIDGNLTIDYESLASILATSYTLEEDDLHKGNYGFYLVERNGKPQVVFFKIDHDLMFVDSIMGFHTRRPFHLIHGAHAFDITIEDLKSLTCLTHSSNSYWPTKFGYIANPFDNKEYHNYADINAFSLLSHNPLFINAKWKSFYKHILIPNELIKQTLQDCAEMESASDRAEVALMTQTTIARIARLRAALFSIKEFRNYVCKLDKGQTEALLKEIIPPHLLTEVLVHKVRESFHQYENLCKAGGGFEEGDTPLHTAIKLGEYRYEETLSMFGEFINVKNKAGKTPLDIAAERVRAGTIDESDAQNNGMLISKHLIQNGAQITKIYRDSGLPSIVKAYAFKNPYLEGIRPNMSYRSFKQILRDIGEDHRFCLKFQKNLALECIKHFIKVNKEHPKFENRLHQLRYDINGYSSEEESAGVKYIRQLRSKLWIIRQLRGLYGWSSTQWEINTLINRALEQHETKKSNSFCFFSCGTQPEASSTYELQEPHLGM